MRTPSLPKVTIGIPTRNRSALLKRALKSAVSQDYPNLEILVSNNASVDDTFAVISIFGNSIRSCTSEKTLTIKENWNRVLEQATGEYFLLLSDDDILAPKAISSLMAGFLQFHENVALVYGASEVMTSETGEVKSAMWTVPPALESSSNFILQSYKGNRYYPTGATLFRTSELRTMDGYAWGGFGLVLDMAMAVKIASLNPDRRVVFVPQVVFTSVLHGNNLSGTVNLSDWEGEIVGLAHIAARKLNLPDSAVRELLGAADEYLIRFVFNLAITKRRTHREFFSLFWDALAVSVAHLNSFSLKTFLIVLCKYSIPQKISSGLVRLKYKKK